MEMSHRGKKMKNKTKTSGPSRLRNSLGAAQSSESPVLVRCRRASAHCFNLVEDSGLHSLQAGEPVLGTCSVDNCQSTRICVQILKPDQVGRLRERTRQTVGMAREPLPAAPSLASASLLNPFLGLLTLHRVTSNPSLMPSQTPEG